MLAPRGGIVEKGDTVIIFHGHDEYRPLKVQPGNELHCKDGKFRHNDMIGAKYGSRIAGRSNANADKNIPTLLILKPSADLWTLAVPHRTQIIYSTDIATIVMNLRVRPGCIVVEAGTGSGSLTHSFARAVAPSGHVHTFDFHKGRAIEARKEFVQNGVSHLITSGWRDVCSTGNNTEAGDEHIDLEALEGDGPLCGFGLPRASVDAVFLDVPSPWAAVANAIHVLRPNGVLCTFSPCVEQTQRTCEALRQDPSEFVDIRTVEVLTKFYDPVIKKTRLEDTSEGSSGDKYSVHFTPQQVSKGHSAFLTFARRRLERVIEKGEQGSASSTPAKLA